MEDNGGVLARLTDETPRVVVVLLEAIYIHASWDVGLVQGLDGGDYVSIATIAGGQSVQGILGAVNSVTLLPLDCTALAAVVKAVLGARSYDSC